jgi:curved DNA-binding protein CbpA|eukprot:COSAG06_NODE_164_length_21596_cov_37.740500_13_plen_272_part_00
MAASEAIANILASDDFFARLGLPRQKAEPAEVRRTYRRRALQCHPDKTDHPRANEAFQQLSEAFECLHEEKSQAAYLRTALQQHRREEQRHQKRKRGDGGGGDGKKRSAAGGTWYQRARSWADIERELARREEAERVMRAQFVASQSSKFNSREAERLLLRAQKICRTLDQRTSDAVNPLWATLVEQEAAAAALSEDLPEGWEARRSHGGVLYYFHAKTGQSSSVHPDPAVAAERERAREGAAAPSAPGAAAGASSSGGGNARGQLTEMLE